MENDKWKLDMQWRYEIEIWYFDNDMKDTVAKKNSEFNFFKQNLYIFAYNVITI